MARRHGVARPLSQRPLTTLSPRGSSKRASGDLGLPEGTHTTVRAFDHSPSVAGGAHQSPPTELPRGSFSTTLTVRER
jgi:hypothetical protein